MTNKKIRIAILLGGKSAEHEVSIQSAKNVFEALDKDKYEVLLLGIDKKGAWHLLPHDALLSSSFEKQAKISAKDIVRLVAENEKGIVISAATGEMQSEVDVVFPVMHGPYGEDGSMQGLLKLSNVPFVGSGVLGSAVAMDKDVSKRLLRDAGLPIGDFVTFYQDDEISFAKVKEQLGLPVFVKPANLGSSIGVKKANDQAEFEAAVKEAFSFDTKVIVEEYIPGKEIECSVLGNDKLKVSLPGEIVATKDFYDYDAKYLDDDGATLRIPADIPESKVKEVQELALRAYKVLCLEGMARIDCFYTKDGKFYVNEANTIPGFTNISMYPKLWEASGISYKDLIDRLVELAIERYEKASHLKTSL